MSTTEDIGPGTAETRTPAATVSDRGDGQYDDRSAPPTYSPPEKVRDEEVRPPLPGVVVDTLFFALATLATAWLAFRLVEDAWRYSWWHLVLLVPFWAVVAYLVLPRLHTLLTSIYVPTYFIARTRTSDGLLGDPVNLALDGTARQIHEAMTAAGWDLADDVTLRSSWGIIVSSVFRRSYPRAPVSPLTLFGRMQCLAYQQEVEGNAAQRHHVRFWRCPDGWLLPGGRRVQWLGAGTYDRAVGLSLFTLQVTHKIDADIDVERDFIVGTLRYHCPEVSVQVIEDFSTGYHSRNGGGDAVRTDGDLPVVDLRAVTVPEVPSAALPFGVVRAARGYDDPSAEGGVVAPDPDRPVDDVPPDPAHLPRPPAIVIGCLLVALSIIVNLTHDLLQLRGETFSGVVDADEEGAATVVLFVLLGATSGAMAVLALLTYLGFARPRVWLLAVTVAGLVLGEADKMSGLTGTGTSAHLGLAVNVLVLLTLTSAPARVWSRRTGLERRARRCSARSGRRGLPTGGGS